MSEKLFRITIIFLSLLFATYFLLIVVPPLIADPNVPAAFAAGFVNPYAAGYAGDVIVCWLILTVWVWYEASSLNIKYGWICILLGIVPGVAVGFGLYLSIRTRQFNSQSAQ